MPLLRGGTGSPSNTMWPGLRSTSVPSGIFIHPAVWPQYTWAENWGRAPLGGVGSPSNTTAWAKAYLPTMCHLEPSTIWPQQICAENWGLCPFWRRGSWVPNSPSNTKWPGLRPTCTPSFMLTIQPFGNNTSTSQTGRTGQTDNRLTA